MLDFHLYLKSISLYFFLTFISFCSSFTHFINDSLFIFIYCLPLLQTVSYSSFFFFRFFFLSHFCFCLPHFFHLFVFPVFTFLMLQFPLSSSYLYLLSNLSHSLPPPCLLSASLSSRLNAQVASHLPANSCTPSSVAKLSYAFIFYCSV